MLRFSDATKQAKLRSLRDVPALAPFLLDRRLYTFDLLSGWSCPFAKDCLAKVTVSDTGKRKLVDGKDQQFRCYSGTQEAAFTPTYNLRKANFDYLRSLQKPLLISDNQTPISKRMAEAIHSALPSDAGVIRLHSAGDFFSPHYFKAWLSVAKLHQDKLFYAYTKSLPYWKQYKAIVDSLPNFVLTASKGSSNDSLIASEGFRSVEVVFSEAEANELPIDHDDSHAADPSKTKQDFALLLHGMQPKGSKAADAKKKLNGKGSYSKRKK